MSAALDRERLCKLLGMLGSDHDGEIVAAARAVEHLRRSAGATWFDILEPATSPASQIDFADEGELIDFVLRNTRGLNAWEKKFIKSVDKWRYFLTPAQRKVLERLVMKIRIGG